MKGRFRFAALSVALAAIMLRAFIPAGWMPQAGTTLAICTIDGIVHVTIGPDGQPVKGTPAKSSEHPLCAFSAAPNLASAEILVLINLPSLAAQTFDVFALGKYAVVARHTPQAPRAPPVSS